ncbi:hypothetical protein [Paraburkholderia mimosarum]|uniref:hypothetical protein n=1 Tax=Paraburkholderia mimosarum TaxID=312026 RepID=UPI0006887B47|nr:hypothetical protein [Paraburkholderia mimosarum]
MTIFNEPVVITGQAMMITNQVNTPSVIIGPGSGWPLGSPAGSIRAGSLLLFGEATGVDVGTPSLSLTGDGVIVAFDAGGSSIRVDSKAVIASDASESSVTINSNGVNLVNSDPQFPSSVVIDSRGNMTLTDPAGSSCSIGGGNLTVSGNLQGADLGVTGEIRVGGDILLLGADCAEHFNVADAKLEPGTVLVIDEGGDLTECKQAYDKKVVGVISGAGDHRPGIILDRQAATEGRAPIALVGKVFCKADATAAPIGVGDLLTTSETPGYAMRADDPNRAFGAVLGKALGKLDEGRGLIPILVALQ